MISTQKKWIYAVVLVMTSALFAHELVQATSTEDPPLPLDAPAEARAGELAAGAAIVGGDAARGVAPQETTHSDDPARVDATANEATLGALERALALLDQDESAGPVRPALVRARRNRNAAADVVEVAAKSPQPEGETTLQETSSGTTARERAMERDELLAGLEDFLEENPLIGVVRGAGGDCALFGGRRVRVGERLFDGPVELAACDELGVQVAVRGRTRRIDLQPLRTRAPSTPPVSEASTLAAPAPARAPALSPQPSPAAPADGGAQ